MLRLALFALTAPGLLIAQSQLPAKLKPILEMHCEGCHFQKAAKGGLDLSSLPFDLSDRAIRERWVRLHDRVVKGEMPPAPVALSAARRAELVKLLGSAIGEAERAETASQGRGPLRRMNRDEYEQNLRDVLQLPHLDIRDILPEDREGHHFNKTSETLDMSRVHLTAYLEAAEVALRQAMATGSLPAPATKFRALGAGLFPTDLSFGEREAMFFAKQGRCVEGKELDALRDDPELELALFRSAHWPYYGYPKGFVAKRPGAYKVRFSARAVVQVAGHRIKPAMHPVPMTFRARKRSGADVSGDVRATGGLMDIQPEARVFETTVRLREDETFEYSLLGLPVPLAFNVNGGPPVYRYPPFPEDGQPGVAFAWLEVEGPIVPEMWPPPSHRVLFGDSLQLNAKELNAKEFLRRFVRHAAREPVSESALQKFDQLIESRLAQKETFTEAMLAGYKAFLSSSHFLYLREPIRADDHFAIAARLSHFLTNTHPDPGLAELASKKQLRSAATLRKESNRLIAGPGFDRFVRSFTDYWLNLRYVRRDEPDIRLYPEYRFDDYLVESMEMETRTFFASMVRDNLPARVLVDANFIFANDRLAKHYGLPALSGSAMRKVTLPGGSPLGGLLTQAAILKVTANGTTTSPVVRGAWMMDRLLGDRPPPPPPKVPAVEPDIRGARTIRELMAAHTKSASCAACHARFDPVGLALENFDILGGWRTHYRSMEQGERVTGIDRAGHDFGYALAAPVDSSGRLLDGRTFKDVRELKALLNANPRQLARNLLQQFTVYATGTPVRFSDRPEVERMLDACSAGGYGVRDLLVALVQSKIFLGPAGAR